MTEDEDGVGATPPPTAAASRPTAAPVPPRVPHHAPHFAAPFTENTPTTSPTPAAALLAYMYGTDETTDRQRTELDVGGHSAHCKFV